MSESTQQYVTEEMTAAQIMEKYPEVVEIFLEYGLSCAGCMISEIESIGDGARAHGMDEDTIAMMLRDANAIAKQVESEQKNKLTQSNQIEQNKNKSLDTPIPDEDVSDLFKKMQEDA